MKTLTIRGLDPSAYNLLRQESKRSGMSMNQFVVHCIERVLGTKKTVKTYHDLDHLFGKWSAKDAENFKAAVTAFDQIDPELWKS